MKDLKRIKAWKVVTQDNCSATIDFENSIYRLQYEEGEITTAPEETFGVFCFSDRVAAQNNKSVITGGVGKVIRVIGIGEPVYPKEVSLYLMNGSNLRVFYQVLAGVVDCFLATCPPPPKTICFPQVFVVGEDKKNT